VPLFITSHSMTASLHRRPTPTRTICASYCAQRHNRHCACIVKNFTPHNLSKKPTDIQTFPKKCEWKTWKYHHICPDPVHILITAFPGFYFQCYLTLHTFQYSQPNSFQSITCFFDLVTHTTIFILFIICLPTSSVAQTMYTVSYDWMITE
jgi:hypothetical protein